ncbi:MAG TPA: SAM-dependent methyltransferase [Thermoanaerobaculia bacterium]
MAEKLIENVSDTARWVAVYRAMESERPDALFHDPYAKQLAGERGNAIVRDMRQAKALAWVMIVRTAVMDELIGRCIEEGFDTVLNLAAGLDVRPYRLQLPPELLWIEVDLPEILTYKEEILADAKPVCRFERVKLDLADRPGRQALFARVAGLGRRVLVVSEGLLVYLDASAVAELAADLRAPATFERWLFDLASPTVLKRMEKTWGKHVAAGNAPFRFGPEEWVDFFTPYGWKLETYRSIWDESFRLKRTIAFGKFFQLMNRISSRKRQEIVHKMSTLVMLERA